ncbi:LOW QUALITY PROTEIN: hypothetical protein PHMEG_00028825 [Phytophthora megakarya]|uniref:Uncharacterized protein n=1 Tax=Phytophthora megakarya TaxID=4795 RepID=A0A225V567_9STRA|nr:LOW QUALITY PROTEIN: hypothetical protein PHMEG_00028825 [Phytophthora megakarya]
MGCMIYDLELVRALSWLSYTLSCIWTIYKNNFQSMSTPTPPPGGGGIDVGSTVFVDCQLDVTTTFEGQLARARVTNLFPG